MPGPAGAAGMRSNREEPVRLNRGVCSLSSSVPRTAGVVMMVVDRAGWAGTERHVGGLLRALASAGHSLSLVASEEGPLLAEARGLGIPVNIVSRTSTVSYILDLKRLLERARPAVLHAHAGRVPCLAARWAGVRSIVETRHGLPERDRRLYRLIPAARRWEAWKCVLAHRTLAVCQADAEWLRGAGLDAARIRIARNGLKALEPSEPAPGEERRAAGRRLLGIPESARLLGLVGRLAPEKAPDRFLDLVARLSRDDPQCIGVVVGRGREEARLRARASGLGIERRLLWLGARPDAERLIAALDLLLLPSRYEGLPFVLLEALRAGVPALCTPVGGVPELLEGTMLSQGCLPWSLERWARYAAAALASERWRRDWAVAARARAEQYPETETVAAVAAVYRELLARPAASSLNHS